MCKCILCLCMLVCVCVSGYCTSVFDRKDFFYCVLIIESFTQGYLDTQHTTIQTYKHTHTHTHPGLHEHTHLTIHTTNHINPTTNQTHQITIHKYIINPLYHKQKSLLHINTHQPFHKHNKYTFINHYKI